MLTGVEIRHRVNDGLATGKLWRLGHEHVALRGGLEEGGRSCHVCDQAITRGHAHVVVRASVIVLTHLECYVFWLHASIPALAGRTVREGSRQEVREHRHLVNSEATGGRVGESYLEKSSERPRR
jgi:hypothetical protein